MFITFEGGEGAGKTTQLRLLAERLAVSRGRVRQTREPGGTPLADALRALLLHPEESVRVLAAAHLTPNDEPVERILPLTEVLLLSAGRAQHVAQMRAWLAAGDIVLCDRYADATQVYQGDGRGYAKQAIIALERLVTDGLVPDLTLLLDLPVDVGRARRVAASAAGGEINRIDREDDTFHERVRQGYLRLAASDPRRWVVVDASQPPAAVAERIWETVTQRLRHA